MEKQRSKNIKKKNTHICVTIISILLLCLSILSIYVMNSHSNPNMLNAVIGFLALAVTMNIATYLKISKENSKIFCMISLLLDVVAIPLLFKHVIYSYVLVVPALILTKNCIKLNKKDMLSIAVFIASLIMLIVCLGFSFGGYFKLLKMTA